MNYVLMVVSTQKCGRITNEQLRGKLSEVMFQIFERIQKPIPIAINNPAMRLLQKRR